MTDLALFWNGERWHGDLALDGGELVTDDGLRTAILISLFTDARAPADAELPQAGGDRRGWWGDAYPVEGGGPLGSLLWLLARSKITIAVINATRDHCQSALQWLLDDGIASRLAIEVEAQGDRRAVSIELDRPDGPARERYDLTWEASVA